MHRLKKSIGMGVACGLLFFCTALLSGLLISGARARGEPELSENRNNFRRFDIAAEQLSELEPWSEKKYRRLTVSFLENGGRLGKKDKLSGRLSWYSLLMPPDKTEAYQNAFASVLADGVCFPVGKDADGGGTWSYEDSWGSARSYGGDRRHEGTDIMSSVNERGYFPVVSVSDGVIEKKGWLRLGGYRLGVRAPHGAYYYYAHLDHYADDIAEGARVGAGELLGYMGDSGYGEEGTVGKFKVHLHFGIYLDIDGREVSVNPYQVLRYLEKKKQIPFDRISGGNNF